MPVHINRFLPILLFAGACSANASGAQPDVRHLTTQGNASASAWDESFDADGSLWVDAGIGEEERLSEPVSVEGGDQDQLWIQPDPAGLDSDGAPLSPEEAAAVCRSQLNVDALDTNMNPVLFVLGAVEVAQADDVRCGPRTIEERSCRAIWLLETLDPLTLAYDPSLTDAEREEAANALDWGLQDGVEAQRLAVDSGTEIPGGGAALDEMASVSRSISVEIGPVIANEEAGVVDRAAEDRLAELIVARAVPAVLEPILALGDLC